MHQRLLPLLPAPNGSGAPRPGPLPDPTAPYRHPHHPLPAPTAAQAAPPSYVAVAVPTVPPAVPPLWPPVTPPPTPVPPQPAPTTDLAAACGEVSDLLAAHRYAEVIDLAARLLPVARAEHGDRAPLVRTLRTIYARTLLQERQYRAALPEYQLLATVAAAEGGPHDPQALDHRRKAAGCLEQLGRAPEALAEYRALLAGHTARLEAGLDTDPARSSTCASGSACCWPAQATPREPGSGCWRCSSTASPGWARTTPRSAGCGSISTSSSTTAGPARSRWTRAPAAGRRTARPHPARARTGDP